MPNTTSLSNSKSPFYLRVKRSHRLYLKFPVIISEPLLLGNKGKGKGGIGKGQGKDKGKT